MKRMVTLLLCLSLNAFASSGIFQSYVIYNLGAGNVYRAGGANADGQPAFNGLNLGTFTNISTLIINGGENKTYKNGADDVQGAKLNYRIYKTGDTPPAFTELDLPFHSNLGNGDQKWTKTNANIDVLSQVTSTGTWKIELYWRVPYNFGTHFDNNSSSNFTATFTADASFPVELASFAAMVNGKNVTVAWQTATELNNHGFEVERSQSGNNSWSSLGFIKGQGTTNVASSYSYTDNITAAGTYSYRLKQIDRDGKFTYSNAVEATVALAPSDAGLHANYPNPFNPSTAISFTLGATGRASLKVYDVLGKEVATLADGMFIGGERNTFSFDATGLTSGVYYYRLLSDAKVETRKMLLMK